MTEQILNDRYALEEKVGEGGMAITYRARDLLLNRTVAVKIMREQFTTDEHFIERFRREAQSAARLTHENIAGVYDTGQANGTYYIVMEFVEGVNLKQRIRREGALPILTALEIGRQIAVALDAAHRKGLVHRDIKPHNIMLNTQGKVKVTDFGIAKMAHEGEDTGVIIGSVHYLSPEQARGEATTPSSDLYSLGAVLFETLTGRTVFEGENPMAVAHKQIYDRPPVPSSLRREISPAIDAIVLRCLEKDPTARYHSAAEVQVVLTQLINQLAQEETIITPIPAPSMDATMVYRAPLNAAHEQQQAPPQRRPLPPEPEPRGGGGASWLIALLFLVLAGAVTYGGFLVFGPPKHDIKPPVTTASVQAPNLIGLTKAQAEDLLKQRGLQGKEGPIEANNDIPKEQVCRQDPAPDATISKDTPVLYWISKGPSSFTMPDVSTMTLDRAKKEIRDAGFQADFKITSENSDQPKQTIIRQDPASGALVDCAKGKVTLVASKGTEVQAVVQETWNPGSAPDLGKDSVYVRIELERPAHSEPKEIYHGTLSPGDKIPVQHFERFANEQVLVRVLAGDDEYSNLTTQTEVLIPSTAPGANAKPAMPGQ